MSNKEKDEELLKKIQRNYQINLINKTLFDVADIIDNLTIFDPPDFVYGKHYIEMFEANSRKMDRKGEKHKRFIDIMKRQVEESQSIFSTTYHNASPDLSHIDYLKENIDKGISKKTKKQRIYQEQYPAAKYKHLLIMIESRCRVLSDGKGGYFNCKQDIDGLTQENYQIYKDYQFMNMIKEKYSSYWNMLLFAEKWNDQFVISCFDLKHDLIEENMIKYPTPLLQLREGSMQTVNTKGWMKTTQIQYQYVFETPFEPLIKLTEIKEDGIMINEFKLYRSKINPTEFSTNDGVLQIETTNLLVALNPVADIDLVKKYIAIPLQQILVIRFTGNRILLGRITPLYAYAKIQGNKIKYRLEHDKEIEVVLDNLSKEKGQN